MSINEVLFKSKPTEVKEKKVNMMQDIVKPELEKAVAAVIKSHGYEGTAVCNAELLEDGVADISVLYGDPTVINHDTGWSPALKVCYHGPWNFNVTEPRVSTRLQVFELSRLPTFVIKNTDDDSKTFDIDIDFACTLGSAAKHYFLERVGENFTAVIQGIVTKYSGEV